MTGSLPHAGRLLTVQQVFKSLPDRYLGAEPGFDATYHLRLADLGQTWEIRLTEKQASVRRGVTCDRPDVTISTDSETWLSLREGGISGIEAFSQRLLYVRGDLDLAVGFEGRFARPGGRPAPRALSARAGAAGRPPPPAGGAGGPAPPPRGGPRRCCACTTSRSPAAASGR